MLRIIFLIIFGLYLTFKQYFIIKGYFLAKKSKEKSEEYIYNNCKKIADFAVKLSRTNVKIIGEENILDEPCVYMGNHQGYFDIIVLLYSVKGKLSFIAKKELKKIPVLRNTMNSMKAAYLDRDNAKEGIKAIRLGVENLKNGISMCVFPEGHRSLGKEMLEFKKGSLQLAYGSNCKIVPFSIEGAHKVIEYGKKGFGNNVTIKFHNPIDVTNLNREEKKELINEIYTIVKKGNEEIKIKS